MYFNKLILSVILTFTFVLSADAYATNDEITSTEALINYNYSAVAAEHVQLVKAQNANKPYRNPRYAKKRWWRKVWEYIDFGTDDGYLMQHDINPGYTWKDL